MADRANPWQLVADVLRAARAELAPDVRSREKFAMRRGARASAVRLMADLERAARDNYDPQTLANAEVWYGLESGQIGRILAGAERLDHADAALAAAQERRAGLVQGRDPIESFVAADTDIASAAEARETALHSLAQDMGRRRGVPQNGSVGGSEQDAPHGRVTRRRKASAMQIEAVRVYAKTAQMALAAQQEALAALLAAFMDEPDEED